MSDLPALRVVRAANAGPMTLDGTRTFVVGRARPVVIDPGPDDDAHLRAIEDALGGARPVAILLTHSHADHAAGAPRLAGRVGAVVYGGTRSLASACHGERHIADGGEIRTDVGVIRAVATPGHARDHLAFWWEGGEAPTPGALFVGDLMMGEGDTTLVAPPEGDLAAYLRSLARIEELAPAVLYPAHGPPIADAREAVGRYREHRAARIRQVAEACAARPGAHPAELVAAVYGPDLHPSLRTAAEGSVRAVLEYLRGTGSI